MLMEIINKIYGLSGGDSGNGENRGQRLTTLSRRFSVKRRRKWN
jgi:hypothetical protein